MSQIKKSSFGLIFILVMVSFFMFGCDKSTPVDDISFNLREGEQIVMLAGEELEIKDFVSITPSFATNQGYELISFDTSIVQVRNKTLIAVSEGVVQIKIVSNDNELKEDLMTVVVKQAKSTLNAPKDLSYNQETGILTFSEVQYAMSYTLMVNELEINLGNSNVFDLKNSGDMFNKLLNVRVKANAPSYTIALDDSVYGETIQIYQLGNLENIELKGGRISFEKPSDDLNVNVYINSELFVENVTGLSVDMNALDEKFCGEMIDVEFETIPNDELKQSLGKDVKYSNYKKSKINVNVLDAPKLEINSTLLTWQNIPYVNEFAVYFDNELVEIVNHNYYDLIDMNDYESITSDLEHSIKVVPIIENVENVALTSKTNLITVRKLETTEISCDGEKLTWLSVENALIYVVSLKDEEEIVKLSTTLTSFEMKGFDAGDYSLFVQAMASNVANGGVYLLPSKVATFDFNKNETVSAIISNYILTITNLDFDACSVEFDVDAYNQNVNGLGSDVNVDLSDYVFEAGNHTIKLKRLGDANSIESNVTVLNFTQLEKISTVPVSNGIASVNRSEINRNAVITFEVKENLDTIFEKQADSIVFNTTNENENDYLLAGSYIVNVYVYGDGSSTFSYRENGDVVAVSTVVEVLPIPSLELKDTQTASLDIVGVAHASSYDIYSHNGTEKTFVENVEDELFDFTLMSGTVSYLVQAKGDGEHYLDSNFSQVVNITRLKTPSMTYNNETKIISKTDQNDELVVAGYVFTCNDVITSYDFNSVFEMAESCNLTLIATAINGEDGEFYLNSLPFELNLTKISNDATISLDENNNLIIAPVEHVEEYSLLVNIDVGTKLYSFTTSNRTLVSGDITLNYDYKNDKYIITLINNYNTIIEDMGDDFDVEVQFIKPSTGNDVIINSETVSKSLSLIKVDNTSTITVNEKNQIVIKPTNLSKEYGISIVINNNSDLTFFSNGSTLVSNSLTLNYKYDTTANSYLIDILDDTYNKLNAVFESNFTIKVKFTNHIDTTPTDLDSVYTSNKTINVLPASTIVRDGQTLKITNVKATYTYENYALLINEEYLLNLDENQIVTQDGYHTLNVNYIYDNTPSQYIDTVNSIKVVVLNKESSETNPYVSTKGDEILIEKAQTLELKAHKYNNNEDGNENNSVVVKIDALSTPYDKEYVFEIYNFGNTNKQIKRFVDSDAVDGVISFNLDDISLNGTILVHVYMSTSDDYVDSKTINVFNSNFSNILSFEKIENVDSLKISNSVLTFDVVDNAVGYEIYEKVSGGYSKITTSLLTSNQYEFTSFTGEKEIVVKAISSDEGFTNSNYSDSIKVYKLSTPALSVSDGKIVVSLPSEILTLSLNNKIKLIPEINNSSKGKVQIDLNNLTSGEIKLNGTNLICEPYLFLAYNSASLMEEELSVQVRVEYNEAIDTYYLNSNIAQLDVYGLYPPTKVEKTASNNETIELINWTSNTKNILNQETINVKYVFKIEYTSGTTTYSYYSNDSGLKYYDKTNSKYVSYPTNITSTSVIFPAGYDADNNGVLDIEFVEGKYQISVQTIPTSNIAGYNLCSSEFTIPYEFEILNKEVLTVVDGSIVWQGQAKANRYEVLIYEQDETEIIVTDTVYTPTYDFTSTTDTVSNKLKGLTGVFRVVVQAISTSNDTVNSKLSDPIYVYRLPEVSSVSIDDGYLILTSTTFFTTAQIEFVNVSTGASYLETYDNTEVCTESLDNLNLTTWQGYTDYATINSTTKKAIKLDGDVLSVLDGGDYTINVTLLGNSNTDVGLINSSKSINSSALQAAKLKPNVVEVDYGVIKFMPHSNYATITNGVYASKVDFNYSFNGATSSEFWSNTALYKIEIKHAAGVDFIYAVDYYSFITYFDETIATTSEYEIKNFDNGFYAVVKYPYSDGTLYFNVYLNNIINLKDYDTFNFYASTETMTDGVNIFESSNDIKTISFKDSGSFTLSISMMGGDSKLVGSTLIGHLNSGANELKTFVRYGINQLSSYEGQIQFNDLVQIIGSETIDNPIYKIVATPLNGSTNQTFYLYYDVDGNSLNNAKLVAAQQDENYLNATYEKVQKDEDLKGILLFDLSKYIASGTYKLTIRTLAGVGVEDEDDANYLLNAKEPTISYTFHKLSDTEFTATNGVLEFNQSYIVNDSSRIYYDNYEITLFKTSTNDEYVYQIGRMSDGVKINDTTHVITYSLPAQITLEKETIAISENVEYQIKIRAISTENYVLNGTYTVKNNVDVELKFKKSLGISESSSDKLRVENGILKWKVLDPNTYTSTVIKITFLDENSQVKTVYITVGDLNKVVENGIYKYHYYEFTDSTYPFDVTGSDYLSSGFNYTINAYLTGQTTAFENILNSNYSSTCVTQRLKVVDDASIKSFDGILTWDAIENATSYEITITGENQYVLTSNTNSLNVASQGQLPTGKYSVKIRAIGNSYINSMISSEVAGFTQLDAIDSSSVKIEGNNIVWGAVENAQGYKVEFRYTDLNGDDKVLTDIVETNSYSSPGGISGKFVITIAASGVGSGKVFNGESVEFTSSNDAPMQVQKIEFDSENSRFNIDVTTADFLASDNLVIVYNFAKYIAQDILDEESLITSTISYQQFNSYKQIDDNTTRYYYPITEMGVYSNIYVQVVRPNTLPSNAVETSDINFKLFSFGSGTESNPYRIYNAEQLLNIRYFTNSNYELTASINMSSVDVQERLNTYNAIIAPEFGGVLDAKDFSISGFNKDDTNKTDTITVSNMANFALFGTLNGATIKNLTIGSENIQLILLNTIANEALNVLKLSVIATGANNSIIDNVKVINFKVQLTSSLSTMSSGSIYIAGLVAEMTNTTVSNSTIKMLANVDMMVSSSVRVYIGGIASTATTSNIDSSQINFALETKTENLFTYVGGVIAYYVGNTSKSTGVSNTTVEFNMSNVQSLHVGGVAGFARYIKINACETTGSYSKQNIAYYTYIGGIVGYAQSSTIQSSGSFINFSLSISNYPDEKYIGAIVGIMTVQNNITCVMSNCYSNVYDGTQEQTSVSTSEIIVGMYGSATGTNITVSGNYKKEK